MIDKNLLFFLLSFFIIGLFADLNIVRSPLKRFFIQSFLIFFLIIKMDLYVYDIRIDFFNSLLELKFFNILFLFFCLSVLLNGSNFIDGNNGIVLSYYLIILFCIIILTLNNSINYEIELLLSLFHVLIILLFFNLFNKIYLGDNGVYVIVIFFSYLLIDIYSKNYYISPYFIVNLLWYPTFETLFSIIRKLKNNFSPMKPDILHLHQLVFSFVKLLCKNSKFANSLTGLIINAYNLIIMLFSTIYITKSSIQILLIMSNIIIYVLIYSKLKNKLIMTK